MSEMSRIGPREGQPEHTVPDGEMIVDGVLRESRGVRTATVRCPFCHKLHGHGVLDMPLGFVTHRVSDCGAEVKRNSPGAYWVRLVVS